VYRFFDTIYGIHFYTRAWASRLPWR
jgi:hypothetical protein